MSDSNAHDAGGDTVPGEPVSGSAGSIIRAARKAQGLDLGTLAAMLKIPLRKLEALENDRHAELQGASFERALAQAACRALKIDPKPVLALLPNYAGNTLEQVNGGLNTPFRERGARADLVEAHVLRRPFVMIPVLLVLAALALFFVPPGVWHRLIRTAGTAAAEVAASAPLFPPSEAASASAGGSVVETPVVVTSVAAEAPSAPAMAGPGRAEGANSAASRPVEPAAAVARDAESPSGALDGGARAAVAVGVPVVIRADADSWVDVLDAQGHSLISRTVMAGESVGLDGVMPMRVKIGNARATSLSLRGENLDLKPWTRDNVARLELK